MPFTVTEFIKVFRDYNNTVQPAQIILNLLALLIIYLLFKGRDKKDRWINLILAFFWLWMGIVYHLIFFTKINQAAYLFSLLFIVQAYQFIINGIIRKKFTYTVQNKKIVITSVLFFTYAILIYPVIGIIAGHAYPDNPTFGLPCPTTIFTLGTLLLLTQKYSSVFVIPLLWSVLGFSAALNLGIIEDTGLIIAGAAVFIILISSRISERKLRTT